MKNRWEKGQEWMSSEQLEDSSESREGDGSGRYWRNYKEMDRYENQLDNWMLWDVGEGNIILIFNALVYAKLGRQW